MATSLLLGLKQDFGLNRSRSSSFFSFQKCHFNRNILPSAPNSVLSFALSFVLEVGTTKLSQIFGNKYISEFVSFCIDKLTMFLLTKLPCNLLSNIFAALSFTFTDAISGLRQFLTIDSPLKMMKNAFYFSSKALFVLKIFKLLS